MRTRWLSRLMLRELIALTLWRFGRWDPSSHFWHRARGSRRGPAQYSVYSNQSQFRVFLFCDNRMVWRVWLRRRRRNYHLNFEKNPHDDSCWSEVGLRGDLSFIRQAVQQNDIFLAEDDGWSYFYCWLIPNSWPLAEDHSPLFGDNSYKPMAWKNTCCLIYFICISCWDCRLCPQHLI